MDQTLHFKIVTPDHTTIRFRLYEIEAPLTSAAFLKILPFTRNFLHARVSGQEIWIDDMPYLDTVQENASVFTNPGEVVLGPSNHPRNKTAGCFGIYYGAGKGLDAANIFGAVLDEDLPLLKALGDRIWKYGSLELTVAAF